MHPTTSLSRKLIRTGVALLVMAVASIGLTLWVTWQLEGGAAAVNEAGRLRMQTWRIVSAAQAGLSADEVQPLIRQFDESLRLLHSGDPTRPLFVPWNDGARTKFALVESLWRTQSDRWATSPPPSALESVHAASGFVHAIDTFVLSIEQEMSRLTAILNLFQMVMMALAIGSAAILVYTG